jgi:4-hydroxy-tetrahydrodipicolinate synthase
MARTNAGRWVVVLTGLVFLQAGCVTMQHHCPVAPVQLCHWGGIYPTVLTPFCDCGVDIKSLEAQLQFELKGGVQGLLVLGTIGEGQYVNDQERAQVISTAVRVAHGSVPVVAGIHTGDVEVARAQLLQAKQLGASAVLVKYLDHCGACGTDVLGFMASLADLQALPIFYYHYPSQTGLHLSPPEIASILGLPGVVGIKESTLDLKEVQAHILLAGPDKAYLSGTGLNLTQFMDLGGNGAMCPEALLMPGGTVRAYHAYLAGHREEARALQKEFFVILPILKKQSPPVAVARILFMAAQDHKRAVSMGHDHPQARLKAALNCLCVPTSPEAKCPLPPLTPHDLKKVARAVKKLKCIDWEGVCLQVPPVPLNCCPGCEAEGGLILNTGSLQLGPGVGQNVLRLQGDGQGGF